MKLYHFFISCVRGVFALVVIEEIDLLGYLSDNGFHFFFVCTHLLEGQR